jgi:hypothetical protein
MQYPAIAQPQYAFAPTFASGGLADAARAVQARGRNEDTMLVHMTPNEVNSLQGLAMAHGGTLTINPDTGLPEASFLKSILPMVAGFALGPAGFGLMTSLQAGLAVGGLTALATGDLGRGLSAGLGAYGGSSLGSALSSTGTQAAQSKLMTDEVGRQMAQDAAAQTAASQTLAGTQLAAPMAGSQAGTDAILAAAQQAPTGFGSVGAGAQDLFTSGGMGRFGTAFSQSAGGPFGTTAAVTGLAQPVISAFEPKPYDFSTMPREESNYAGPYLPSEREARFPTYRDPRDSSEFSYFSPSNPYPGFRTAATGGAMHRYQEGGEVDRQVRFAGEDFQGGIDPEFQHNFRPVEVYTPPAATQAQGIPAMIGGKGGGIRFTPSEDGGSTMGNIIARALFGGRQAKRNPNIPEGMSAKDAEKYGYDRYTNPANMRFDPRTQRLVSKNMASGGLAALNAYSQGGLSLDDGAFIVDARSVSELGNGSSSAGQERLAQLGGKPIKGPGDGVSDSIPATIGGDTPARVARDEVLFDREAVRRMGGGSVNKGANKLYAMMENVHDKRKKAKRGQDTKAHKHMPT